MTETDEERKAREAAAREARREYERKRYRTPERRAQLQAAKERFSGSEKDLAAKRRYNQSEKGRLTSQREDEKKRAERAARGGTHGGARPHPPKTSEPPHRVAPPPKVEPAQDVARLTPEERAAANRERVKQGQKVHRWWRPLW